MTDERKSVEKKEVEEKKHKYISAYKGKDEWLKTQEYEEAIKTKKAEWKWTVENDSREKIQNKNTCLSSLKRRTRITTFILNVRCKTQAT